jgi:hypothetical protein
VTIEQGTNVLAGTSRDTILKAWNEIRGRPRTVSVPPLWDGAAAQRCLDVFTGYFHQRSAFHAQPGSPLSALVNAAKVGSGDLSGSAIQ